MKISVLVLSILLTLGCATKGTYQMSSVRDQLNQARGQVSSAIGDVQKDYQKKLVLMEGLKKAGAPMNKAPYPGLLRSFNSTMLAKAAVVNSEKELIAIQSSVNAIKNDKVGPKDAEYGKMKEAIDRFKRFKEKLNNNSQAYQFAANQFAAIANKEKISKVDVSKARSSVKAAIQAISSRTKSAREQIGQARKSISSKKNVDKKLVRTRLNKLDQILKKINAENKAASSDVVSFEKTVKGKREILVGPHLKGHKSVLNLKTRADKINSLFKEYNLLVKKPLAVSQ